MKRLLPNLFLTFVLALLVNISLEAKADVNPSPTGETMQYKLRECNYSWDGGASWSPSHSSMILKVAFEDQHLYIENMCGAGGWSVGDISADHKSAVFKSPQQVKSNATIHAVYQSGNNEIELDEFYLDFSDDLNEISLRDSDGHDVILKVVKSNVSGTYGMMWKDIVLERWTETPATPPAGCEISSYIMDFINAYGNLATINAQILKKDNKVWITNFAERGYLEGEILANGDIRFPMPQYMGISGNYTQYSFCVQDYVEQDHLDLIAQSNGGYKMQTGMQLWAGQRTPEYCVIYEAELTPKDNYTAAPLPPINPTWNAQYPNCIDFEMTPKTADGKEMAIADLYWQIIVNDVPYVFTAEEYPQLIEALGADTDMIPAGISITETLQGNEQLKWGSLGNNKYRCYLPNVPRVENIQIRAGGKDNGSMKWSNPVEPINSYNILPEEALYSCGVNVDTEYTPYYDKGFAMYAKFGDKDMQLAGFFSKYEYIDAQFTDNTRTKAIVKANQVIGVNADGVDVTLVPATAELLDPTNQYGGFIFTELKEFPISIGIDGKTINLDSSDIYLLEVTNGNQITNVWWPDLKMNMVTEKKNVIPEGASIQKGEMSYIDVRSELKDTEVTIATLGDDVWMQFSANLNWFVDKDLNLDICLKGTKQGDKLTFNLPQFVGIHANYLSERFVSYATADSYSFDPSVVTFEKGYNDTYISEQEIWIGTGEGMATWRATQSMIISLRPSAIDQIIAEDTITFTDGKFISSEGNQIEIYNLAGIRLDNRNLPAGTYIVVTNGTSQKISVR